MCVAYSNAILVTNIWTTHATLISIESSHRGLFNGTAYTFLPEELTVNWLRKWIPFPDIDNLTNIVPAFFAFRYRSTRVARSHSHSHWSRGRTGNNVILRYKKNRKKKSTDNTERRVRNICIVRWRNRSFHDFHLFSRFFRCMNPVHHVSIVPVVERTSNAKTDRFLVKHSHKKYVFVCWKDM